MFYLFFGHLLVSVWFITNIFLIDWHSMGRHFSIFLSYSIHWGLQNVFNFCYISLRITLLSSDVIILLISLGVRSLFLPMINGICNLQSQIFNMQSYWNYWQKLKQKCFNRDEWAQEITMSTQQSLNNNLIQSKQNLKTC